MARILVIEDDDDLRASMVEVLQKAGHVVASAADGAKGYTAIEDFKPRLAIIDVFLPVQDGLETIVQIRKDSSNMKIIAISGTRKTRQADYLRAAMDFGADAALHKPFENERLLDVVDGLLDGDK